MAHARPTFHGKIVQPGHKKGAYSPHGGKTYKALPSMKYEPRRNIDLTRPRFTLVAPIQRAPTAQYHQLNPSVREGRVVMDWTGVLGGPLVRTTQPGLVQRNTNSKNTKGRPVA